MPSEHPPPKVARIDLTGRRIRQWTVAKRAKLVRLIRSTLKRLADVPVDPETQETTGEKAKKLTSKGLRNVEARLDQQHIENRLKLEQIQKTYQEREYWRVKRLRAEAETRKIHAEAEGQELDNIEKRIDLFERLGNITGCNPPLAVEGEPGDELLLCPPSVAKQLKAKLLELEWDPSEEEGGQDTAQAGR